jgi:hypothetical protein
MLEVLGETTAVDMIIAIVALYGALLSTVNLLRSSSRLRRWTARRRGRKRALLSSTNHLRLTAIEIHTPHPQLEPTSDPRGALQWSIDQVQEAAASYPRPGVRARRASSRLLTSPSVVRVGELQGPRPAELPDLARNIEAAAQAAWESIEPRVPEED